MPATASASEIIDRNASNVSLKVATNGQALVSYNARGKRWNVLAWGAVNAIQPTTARPQVEFRLDYSGGYGTYKRDVWKTFKDACGPTTARSCSGSSTGCKAADGSYWALQAWQRMLPNYGLRDSEAGGLGAPALALGGPLAELTVHLNWAYRKYHHIFGSFTYLGKPVHGFKSTPAGVPLDTFGRNLYLDTFNSAYGEGWKRENSFLMHKARASSATASTATAPGLRPRRALSRDDHRPGRDAGHLLVGRALTRTTRSSTSSSTRRRRSSSPATRSARPSRPP